MHELDKARVIPEFLEWPRRRKGVVLAVRSGAIEELVREDTPPEE